MRMTTLFLALTFFARVGHAQEAYRTPDVAVGPQYDSTHVYVGPKDFHRFVASFIATFGGSEDGNSCGANDSSGSHHGAVQGPDWARGHHPVAGRRQHSALLAYDRAALQATSDHS